MVIPVVESDAKEAMAMVDPEVPERAKARRHSAAYKLRIVQEYESLGKAGKGSLLRREGLYSSLVCAWRRQRDRGAIVALAQSVGRRKPIPENGSWRSYARRRRTWNTSWRKLGGSSRSRENSPRSWRVSLHVDTEGATVMMDRDPVRATSWEVTPAEMMMPRQSGRYS